MTRASLLAALIVSCALGPERAAAQAAVAQQAPAMCTPDPQLTEAAAELLLARIQRPSAQALAEAVHAAGSDGVGLHALFVPAGSKPDVEQQWLATLRSRVDGQLACGRADNEAGRLLIGLGRGAELGPIDPSARIVRGQLGAGFEDAELVIEDGDAQLLRVGVNAESLRKGIRLAPELKLPLKVQLVARGPSGPRPVAERQLAASETASAVSEPRTTLTRSIVSAPERDPGFGGSEFDGAAAELECQRRADARSEAVFPLRPARDPRGSVAALPGERASAASASNQDDDARREPGVRSGVPGDAQPESAAHSGGSARDQVSGAQPESAAHSGATASGQVAAAKPESAAHSGALGPEAAGAKSESAARSGAQAFSELVLQLRSSRGRRSLRSNRLLREAAEQHAREVCAKGRVAHEVEAGEGPSTRLAKAGLDARLLGEAIARAEDTNSALHALQNSPSHLYTLLDPRFTDFGIGVAKDQAEKFCYVVLLCAWPRYVGKRQ